VGFLFDKADERGAAIKEIFFIIRIERYLVIKNIKHKGILCIYISPVEVIKRITALKRQMQTENKIILLQISSLNITNEH
jgi:hypothetical protein